MSNGQIFLLSSWIAFTIVVVANDFSQGLAASLTLFFLWWLYQMGFQAGRAVELDKRLAEIQKEGREIEERIREVQLQNDKIKESRETYERDVLGYPDQRNR